MSVRIALILCTCLLVASAVAAPTAGATKAWFGPTAEIFVTAHDASGASWFEVRGLPGRNPDIAISPGALVTIHFTNNGTMPHNFFATALGGIPCCLDPGTNATGSFIAPTADTNVAYTCQPHATVMRGRFVVGEGADVGTPLPGYLIALALAVAVLSVRKRFGNGPRRQA